MQPDRPQPVPSLRLTIGWRLLVAAGAPAVALPVVAWLADQTAIPWPLGLGASAGAGWAAHRALCLLEVPVTGWAMTRWPNLRAGWSRTAQSGVGR